VNHNILFFYKCFLVKNAQWLSETKIYFWSCIKVWWGYNGCSSVA